MLAILGSYFFLKSTGEFPMFHVGLSYLIVVPLQKELPIFYIARCKAVGHISMIQGISHRKLKE